MTRAAFFRLKMKTIADHAERIALRELLLFHLGNIEATGVPNDTYGRLGRVFVFRRTSWRIALSVAKSHEYLEILRLSLGITHVLVSVGPVGPVTFQQHARLSDAVSAGIQLQTAGGSKPGDCQADQIARGRESASDAARRDRLGQDLHNG